MLQTRHEIERATLQRNSVIRIQAAHRGHREIKLYKEVLRSSCLIQAQWRSYCARFQFHIHRGASIFMQRTYRHYRFKRSMSIRLQAFIRGARTRRSFQLRRSSACKIQHWMIGRFGRCDFVRKRDAAITVQALCRGMWDEACFFLQKVMAVRLESTWRRYLQSTKFVSLRSKTIRVQAITRGYFERQKFCRMREAAVAIQATLRMFLSMKYVQALKTSSTQVQKWWRAIAAKQSYSKVLRRRALSIIKLQSWYRCNIQVYKFVICQFSIICIQSAWRGYQKRCEYSDKQEAVSKIQSGCRKRLLWNHKLRAIVRLQSLARYLVAKRRQNALLAQKRKADKLLQAKQRRKMKSQQRQSAAIMLQAAFRKYKMRIKNRAIAIIQRYFRQQRLVSVQQEAATQVQSFWRCHSRRKYFCLARKAAGVVVSFRRAVVNRRVEWSSCIAIQRSWRGFYGRLLYSKLQERIIFLKTRGDFWKKLKVQSASLIENQWRATKARSSYKHLRRCVVAIQSLWRAKRTRIAFVQARSGLISFQILVRKRCQLRCKSCILIQRNLRMVLARKIYSKWLSLIIVQQELKMVFARKSYLKWKSCVLIQRTVRMVSAHRRFMQMRATLMQLQNEARIFFDRKVSASIVLQRNWRMWATRKRYMLLLSAIATLHQRHCVQVHRHRTRSMAARSIQANWRLFYQSLVATRKMQRLWRSYRLHGHVCRIQSSFRAFKARQAFRRQRLAAVIIESWYRCASQRFRLLIKVICATIIQSVHRGCLQRRRIQKARKSVAVVESAWVSHKRKKAATHLQASWRSFKMHRSFVKARKGCLLLQAVCRRKLFLLRVQKNWRMRVFQPKRKDTRPGVVKLQSLLRGRLQRRDYKRTYSMIVVMQTRASQRISIRNKSAPCLQAALHQQLHHSMIQQACLVQAMWRGVLCRAEYRVTRHGLILCQKRMKQRCLRKVEASKVLQRQLRMRHIRSMFNQKRTCAVHLQAWFRRAIHKARFCKIKAGIVMLQRLARRRSALHFVAAVTIQSTVRKILACSSCDQVRKTQEKASGAVKLRNGAVKIQSAYRMRCLQSRYRNLIVFVNVLQKHWRQRQCLDWDALLHKSSRQEVGEEISPYKLKDMAPIMQVTLRSSLIPRSLPMSGGAFCYGISLNKHTKSRKSGYTWPVHAQQRRAPVGKVSALVHSRSPACIKRDQLNVHWKKSILVAQEQLKCALFRVSNMLRGSIIAPDPHVSLQPFQSYFISSYPELSVHEQRLVSDAERINLIGQFWESLSEFLCQLGRWIILRLQKHPISYLQYLGGALLAILTNKGVVGLMSWASKLRSNSFPSNMDPAIVLAGNDPTWCLLDKALDILKHAFSGIELSLFLRSDMVQDLEKIVLLVAFLAFASTAALVGSPFLSTSFLGLGVSVLAQKPNSVRNQEGARSIQTCWRRYRMKKLFATRKAGCVRIQRLSRTRQETKMRASVKIQRRVRLFVKSIREDAVVSQPCPETKLFISRGPQASLSKYLVVCGVILVGTILLEARYAYKVARLAFFIMELLGARLILAQICRRRQEALEKQERCISRLQHAFRRRQALKKWKADIGVYDHEQQFCAKLQNFERLVDKLKCDVSNEMVEAPKNEIVDCGGQMLQQVWAEFLSEEKSASQIQRWWRKLSPTHEAARLIQHWFRGIQRRQAFLKFRRAAKKVQSFLWTTVFAKRKAQMVNNILKELMNRRQKILSAVTLQRWFRVISAMSKLRRLKQKKSFPQVVQFDERYIVAEAIRGYCEDRHCARKAMVEEEEILHPGSNSVIIAFSSGDDDDSIADSTTSTDIKFYIAEAENYNESLLVFPMCATESFVRVSETDSGVELEQMTAITEQGSKCCGFEVFLP